MSLFGHSVAMIGTPEVSNILAAAEDATGKLVVVGIGELVPA